MVKIICVVCETLRYKAMHHLSWKHKSDSIFCKNHASNCFLSRFNVYEEDDEGEVHLKKPERSLSISP